MAVSFNESKKPKILPTRLEVFHPITGELIKDGETIELNYTGEEYIIETKLYLDKDLDKGGNLRRSSSYYDGIRYYDNVPLIEKGLYSITYTLGKNISGYSNFTYRIKIKII